MDTIQNSFQTGSDGFRKLIENLTLSYNIVYTVNMSDDSFRMLRMDDDMVGHGMEFQTFSQAKDFFIENVLHPSDRQWMRQELDYGNIRNKLTASKTYCIEYRGVINGAPLWHEMRIASIEGDNIAIGFAVKDLEIIKRHIEDKRFEEYLALFIIDLDTETIKPLKTSPLFKTAETGTAVPYEEAMKTFAAIYEGEAKELFTRISDLQYVTQEFATDDKRTASYKAARLGEDKWIDVTAYAVRRHYDGTPAMVSLGFTMVDSITTQRKEMQRRMTSDMQMIGGLASGYHALYLFNINENFFRVYSLDEKHQPEAAEIVGKGDNPMDTFRTFVNSDMVHPDDRHLLQALSVESVRKKLEHSKKFSIRFRRKFGNDYLWTEMDVIKNEDIDEQANAVAIGFAMRDSEIRSEQTLKECYSVLGNRLSPNEAIDRLMSLAGEYYGGERAYIFEYEKGKNVYKNTYEWCKEGIEPMISMLQDIPSREVEGWIRLFERQGAFHMDVLDCEHNTPEGVAILEMQGIQSIIAAPILNGDEIVGFIGVDNPTRARHHLGILKSISIVAYSEILQKKENDEEHITLQKLTDTFLSVYYVDLSRDYMHNWKIDEKYKEYGAVKRYSESMGGYMREKIAVRDRERCTRMASPEYILEQFRTKDRFSISTTDIMLGYERDIVFDYVKVSEDGNRLVICCRDMTESLAKERKQQQQLQNNLEIIRALADEYGSVYYVDLESGAVTPYSMDEMTRQDMQDIFRTNVGYSESFKTYVEKFVYQPDREMMLRESDKDNIREKLSEANSKYVTFRMIHGNTVSFCEMKYVAARRENGKVMSIVIGFAHKDDEIMAQYINEKLAAEYISAFMVDLDNNKYRIYRHPDTTNVMEREDRSWSAAMADFANECDPEYYELVNNMGSPEFLKKELARVDRREYLYRFPSASKPWRRSVIQVIDRKDGVPSNVVATFMAIDDYQSKIKDQQKQLETQQKQLEAALQAAEIANRSKTSFLFNMSHDIRTPMNAITGFTIMAKKYAGDPVKVNDYLNKIDLAGQQLLMLINQVLEMSRIEAGKIELEEKPVNVREGYDALVTILAEQAKEKGLDFHHSLGDIRHYNVFADDARMSQITLNIAGNAIKYTPEGGKVDYSLKELPCSQSGYARYEFTVSDTGIGMSEEFQKIMFEPFAREKNTTVSRIQGTGLGMSIVKNLVDLMNGTIQVHSEPGKGSTFIVRINLKIDKAADKAMGMHALEVDPAIFSGMHALLVEDNELNREIAKFLLEDQGIITEEADDGDTAVEKIRHMAENGEYGHFDFILMDVQMPRMSGYEATERIRRILEPKGYHIPVIAMTANAFEEDRQNALNAGMDDHLAKPIDVRILWETLARHL